MNKAIEFVQNWLVPNEKVVSYVDEVRFRSFSWSVAPRIGEADSTPTTYGSLLLTNRRLVVLQHNSDVPGKVPPMWYSVTCIAGLRERPPGINGWPYQAGLTLYSGVFLVIETPKDKIDERGRELSIFLNNALMSLDNRPRMGGQMSEFIEDEKRKAESQQSKSNQDAK